MYYVNVFTSCVMVPDTINASVDFSIIFTSSESRQAERRDARFIVETQKNLLNHAQSTSWIAYPWTWYGCRRRTGRLWVLSVHDVITSRLWSRKQFQKFILKDILYDLTIIMKPMLRFACVHSFLDILKVDLVGLVFKSGKLKHCSLALVKTMATRIKLVIFPWLKKGCIDCKDFLLGLSKGRIISLWQCKFRHQNWHNNCLRGWNFMPYPITLVAMVTVSQLTLTPMAT